MTDFSEAEGSPFDASVDALVNTVNTVGVMGKGIALEFKTRFPANFKDYERACELGEVRLGEVFVFDFERLFPQPRWIFNFPTKEHWRSPSLMANIEAGLADLRRVIEKLDVSSIAIPALGCGNGGLDWSDVRPRIESALDGLKTKVQLYPPTSTPRAAERPIQREEVRALRPEHEALAEGA